MKAFTGLHAYTENKRNTSEWKPLQAYMPTQRKIMLGVEGGL
jgi:hypothetical protein